MLVIRFYDANGNRTSVTVNGVSICGIQVDAQDRLLSYGGTTYTYTPAGERRTKTRNGVTTTYDWDGFGDLVAVSSQTTRIEYVYDAQQRRIGRRKWNTATSPPTLMDERHWLYGDQLRVVAELDQNNAILSRFVYGTQANVPDYVLKAGVTYRIVSDQLGSVRLVVNTKDGTIAERADYSDAFGTPASSAALPVVPFGFGGGIFDVDTGLVHFGARDYEPLTGTWLAKEPSAPWPYTRFMNPVRFSIPQLPQLSQSDVGKTGTVGGVLMTIAAVGLMVLAF